jgi:hypothetical protein
VDSHLETECWPADLEHQHRQGLAHRKDPLKTEVETGTCLTATGQVEVLPATQWQRKRFCQYDAIRHDLKRISDTEWTESQRRCKALDQDDQDPPAPPAAHDNLAPGPDPAHASGRSPHEAPP